MDNIPAQVVGFLGAGAYFVCFQQKKRRNILIFTVLASCLFVVHFLMLGAYTGAALNAVNAVRSVIYANNGKRWASSKLWLVFFLAVSSVSCILTWKDAYSLFPLASMLITSVSYWLKDEKLIRLITLPTSPSWFIYNMHSGSVSGMITELIVSASLITAIIRYDVIAAVKKKKELNNNAC